MIECNKVVDFEVLLVLEGCFIKQHQYMEKAKSINERIFYMLHSTRVLTLMLFNNYIVDKKTIYIFLTTYLKMILCFLNREPRLWAVCDI